MASFESGAQAGGRCGQGWVVETAAAGFQLVALGASLRRGLLHGEAVDAASAAWPRRGAARSSDGRLLERAAEVDAAAKATLDAERRQARSVDAQGEAVLRLQAAFSTAAVSPAVSFRVQLYVTGEASVR